MEEYEIKIVETTVYRFYIEAKDYEEAEDKGLNYFYNHNPEADTHQIDIEVEEV